jgi:hypothetical protein
MNFMNKMKLKLKHARAFAIEGFLTQRYDGWSVCEQYLHSVLLLSANIRTSNLLTIKDAPCELSNQVICAFMQQFGDVV